MKNKKRFFTPARIVLSVVNLLAILLFFFYNMMLTSGHVDISIISTIVGELIFLIVSLIVYYLFIIASSVSKIADTAIEDSEKEN